MAQKIPFFELFTDFSPDFDLRVPLNAAMVTNMVLEPEKRTMTLDMTVRATNNAFTSKGHDINNVAIVTLDSSGNGSTLIEAPYDRTWGEYYKITVSSFYPNE